MRRAHLAGQWYPDDERACRAALLSHAVDAVAEQGDIRGAVAPHAGFRFSGDAAGAAYSALAAKKTNPELVVVFGNHLGFRDSHTLFRGTGWETPLGPLAVDETATGQLASAYDFETEPLDRPDNGSELQMPFARHFFPSARLLMLGVAPRDDAVTIGELVGRATAGRDAVFVGSTDLTHYGPNFTFEPEGPSATRWVTEVNDRRFIDRVLAHDEGALVAEALQRKNACCPGANITPF
ncbi:MAG: AmmeMemoRadiSam system protein B [Myxococcota bacterium]